MNTKILFIISQFFTIYRFPKIEKSILIGFALGCLLGSPCILELKSFSSDVYPHKIEFGVFLISSNPQFNQMKCHNQQNVIFSPKVHQFVTNLLSANLKGAAEYYNCLMSIFLRPWSEFKLKRSSGLVSVALQDKTQTRQMKMSIQKSKNRNDENFTIIVRHLVWPLADSSK